MSAGAEIMDEPKGPGMSLAKRQIEIDKQDRRLDMPLHTSLDIWGINRGAALFASV